MHDVCSGKRNINHISALAKVGCLDLVGQCESSSSSQSASLTDTPRVVGKPRAGLTCLTGLTCVGAGASAICPRNPRCISQGELGLRVKLPAGCHKRESVRRPQVMTPSTNRWSPGVKPVEMEIVFASFEMSPGERSRLSSTSLKSMPSLLVAAEIWTPACPLVGSVASINQPITDSTRINWPDFSSLTHEQWASRRRSSNDRQSDRDGRESRSSRTPSRGTFRLALRVNEMEAKLLLKRRKIGDSNRSDGTGIPYSGMSSLTEMHDSCAI